MNLPTLCLFLGLALFPNSPGTLAAHVEPPKTPPLIPVLPQQAPVYALPADSQTYYQQAGAVLAAPLMVLGSPCADNFTCSALPNSYCGQNLTCQCMTNFMEDPIYTGTCRLAPGYNELCAVGEIECRQPFVCNSTNMCDCKPGFLQEYFQCVKDCPAGQVPVGDGCMQARQLEEKCETSEQCMQAYSQCLHNKCQCIMGTNQLNGHCYPVNQCPLGEPTKDKRGKTQTCASDNEEVCPKDFYCLHAELGSPHGFCCPKIKMNCPIGQPLEGHNCTNCPWDTHHCFSYVIGTYTETMCCPNACPANHPIQKDGKCFAKSAYRGHCMVDEQCYNVLGSSCRKDKDGKSKCQCPEGNFRNYYGRCLREAGLGEDCTTNEECRQGTNTLCSSGVCSCFNGYIPEPKSKTAGGSPQRCIAEPACPTPAGLKPMESYTECLEDAKNNNCKETEFCRRWWNEANHTYSLCCPKPKLSDYEAMCKPFRMKLLVATTKKTEPTRCDIAALPHQQFYTQQDAAGNGTAVMCPAGASCLYDPYSTDKGICCKPDETAPPIGQSPAAVPAVLPPVGIAKAAAAPSVHMPSTNSTIKPDEQPEDEEDEIYTQGPKIVSTPVAAASTSTPPKVPGGAIPTSTHGPTPTTNRSTTGGSTNKIPLVRIRGFDNNQG